MREDEERYKIVCPKCGGRKIWAREWIQAYSDHYVDNGVWEHERDSNDFGEGIKIEFTCDSCGHKWTGRKGVTMESYNEDYQRPKKHFNLWNRDF